MKMTDESALAVLDSILMRISFPNNERAINNLPEHEAMRDHIAARLAADQQKGGGEWCPACDGAGWAPDAMDDCDRATCPDCAGSGLRENSITANESQKAPQPSIPAPAQQDGKASGGEVDDAMVKIATAAYNAACDAGRRPCPNCAGTRRERDNYTECGTCEGAGWKWDESAPGPMRAALTAALAHPPHADQETQG